MLKMAYKLRHRLRNHIIVYCYIIIYTIYLTTTRQHYQLVPYYIVHWRITTELYIIIFEFRTCKKPVYMQ